MTGMLPEDIGAAGPARFCISCLPETIPGVMPDAWVKGRLHGSADEGTARLGACEP